MSDEIKYCKFCNKEKPIKEFVKSGFAIKNICRECQNKKQAQIYRDSKKVKELEKENQELKKQLHEASIEIQHLIEENMSCPSSCSKIEELKSQKQEWVDLLDKFKTQQKEFIEWLENEIKYWEKQEQQWIKLGFMKFGGEANNKIIFKKVLSKYKEITGVKDE